MIIYSRKEDTEMEKEFKCTVNFLWDNESAVWIATSEDVPGLVLEDESLDALQQRVEVAIPELLALNHHPENVVDYSFISRKNGRAFVYG